VRLPTRSDVVDAAPRVAHAVRNALRQVPPLASYAAQLSMEAAGTLRERARQRLNRDRPVPPAPPEAAVEAGAPGTARPVAERVAAERAASSDGEAVTEVPEAADLPISDWDHASMPSLRARVARLTLDELLQLREYETEHAARLAVLTMLDNRIAKVDRSSND
jgi:hypothetical protein